MNGYNFMHFAEKIISLCQNDPLFNCLSHAVTGRRSPLDI